MEIIHVVLGKANPERMNGVNKVVYQLASHQVAAGRKVTLWGITKDTTVNFPERSFDTKLFRAFSNKFRLDPELISAISRQAGKKTVYHLHGGFNPEMYSVARELSRQKQSYVFTPHGAYNTIAMRKSRLRKKIYFRLFEKKLLKGAGAIHSLGSSEIQGLRTIFPNDKSVLIPYGFRASGLQRTPGTGNQFIIGYCGRIDIYTKGLDLLVLAFAKLVKTLSQAELWIIGGGKEDAKLKKMVEALGIENKVKCWGALFGEKKDEVMSRFTVFAHPSRNEGLPTAVLEAAAMGIPCVVTQATNTAEVISKYAAGETIAEPDTEALCDALLRLHRRLAVEGISPIALQARNMVKEEFNWDKIVLRFDNLYQEYGI